MCVFAENGAVHACTPMDSWSVQRISHLYQLQPPLVQFLIHETHFLFYGNSLYYKDHPHSSNLFGDRSNFCLGSGIGLHICDLSIPCRMFTFILFFVVAKSVGCSLLLLLMCLDNGVLVPFLQPFWNPYVVRLSQLL